MERFELNCVVPAPREKVFAAWLSAEGHAAMTGSPATVDMPEKGDFTAWDGYIAGKTLEAQASSRILQSWRTSDFGDSDEDSILEILFAPAGEGTALILKHSKLPDGSSADYKQGWLEFYFDPMKKYFAT